MARTSIVTSTGVVYEIERRGVLRLLGSSAAPVVVISAPAGSGKSVVARQWVSRSNRAHAEVRAATYMDDPAILLHAIVDALESIGPSTSEMRALIAGKQPALSSTVLPALARTLQSRSKAFVLTVDDVHLLKSADSHLVLSTLCESCPDGSAVVLLTRSQTPEWLARIRATGHLTEIDSTDLVFDLRETALLLDAMDVRLGKKDVAAVLEHTEGWPVGVYLTALSLRAGQGLLHDDVRLAKGSDRVVADYLRTQVLSTLSEPQLEFLTQTSILDELSGPLCDAVLATTGSAAMLADLHRKIQLVISVDDDPPRYRCHHLLGEVLVADLHTRQPECVPELHRRAAEWFHANGDRDAAIRHATAAGDVSLVSQILWPAVPGCVASGKLDRLTMWLSGLTDEQIANDRWLSMAATWAALQRGDAVAMGHWALVCERHAGPNWREAASKETYAATVAVLYALLGIDGLKGTRDLCDRALSGLAPDDRFRTSAALNRGVVQTLQDEREAGQESLIEAEELGRSLDVPVVVANSLSWRGMLALESGKRELGIQLISEAAQLARRHHLDQLATGAVNMTAQAMMLALVGDKSAATTTFATARRLSGLTGDIAPWFAVAGRLYQARTAVLLGDGATARLLLAEASEHMTPELRESSVGRTFDETEVILAKMADHDGTATVLTTTELRVLQFLPSHLTLQQIGEHLFVSQSTVKTHVLSIYRKFGVSSRADAVEKAKSLGLVESSSIE